MPKIQKPRDLTIASWVLSADKVCVSVSQLDRHPTNLEIEKIMKWMKRYKKYVRQENGNKA